MFRMRAIFAALAVITAGVLSTAGPAAAGGAHALITGSGSSWSSNAINQWIADVHSNGLQVVFSANGSASGRQDYANKTVDFAVSDIGFQGTDPATGASDTSGGRSFAYLPIVAGGTALPYQIKQGGQLVRNLRLSGETVARIFSGQIKNWNDPQIKRDNNGRTLPDLTIIPVVHSEGSGSTYQFTRYLAKDFASVWGGFSGVGATEYFPQSSGSTVRENGSDGVMNFISSAAANGAIGYDEYSYALGKNYPVAKLLNTGGYFTLPNQYNVAVALTRAVINTDKSSPDYLLQNLDNVYSYGDPRVYPMSSYSYAIIPTAADDSKMTTAKRQTLADYLDYSVCQGQGEMGRVGYSPLPINLVQASFDQILKLHAADSKVDVTSVNVTSCHNPTFVAGNPKANYLARVAPQPQACDRTGAGPCQDNGNTGQLNPNQGGATSSAGGSSSGSNGSTGSGSSSGTGSGRGTGTSGGTGTNGILTAPGGGTTATGPLTAAGRTVGRKLDPTTGQYVLGNNAGGAANGATNGTADGAPVAQTTTLADPQSPSTDIALGVLAGALLLSLLVLPPAVSSRMAKR
ncbi:MAG TPA: substrate-binding domain-containing protein [Jatrophihabitans sp.]|jgi:phosphate ABC transporter phosphate-binding protein|uniref:substrate-binding domain-containing protein n=1 Tax=Jatrophihabitans sp. TaxID=1932789 RepID=UPI002DF9272B|nr:substrate-binding domain-containing protein [Jatrophihabitans sp.]